jgi:pimeloyl-ACP methyl ester carboxylesterase
MALAPWPLIFLPGALDGLEGADRVVQRLGADRLLIRIAYRPDDTIDRLASRIMTAADEAGAARFDLLGQSFGGWIAQCLARLHPDRTRRLVLSHSFTLAPSDGWRFRLGAGLLQRMPLGLLRPLLLKRVRQALAPLRETDAELVERQIAVLSRDLQRPGFRDRLVAQQRCMRESLALPAVTAAPREDGPTVMIIESDNDPLIGARARQALRDRYPQAEVHCFAGAGHISAMVETEAYLSAVQAFLDD